MNRIDRPPAKDPELIDRKLGVAGTIRLALTSITLTLLPVSPGASAATLGHAELREAYSRYDQAYARSNPAGMSALYGDRVSFTDANGKSESLGADRIRANNAFHVRSLPGQRIARDCRTEIMRVADAATGITVSLRRTERVAETDRNGTTGIATAATVLDDVWRLTPAGPRIVEERVRSLRTAVDAHPSPAALAAIANIRESARILQDFNKGINESYCMTAAQNEKFDLETRRERCVQ